MASLQTGLAKDRAVNLEWWPSGSLYVSNGLDVVRKWNGRDSALLAVGVEAPSGAPTLGGSGSGGLTGDYYALVRYLDHDDVPGPPSAFSAKYTAASKGQFDYTNVPVPVDTGRVRRKQILRTTAGQAGVFYVDVDTTALATTSFSSDQTDAELQLLGPDMVLPVVDDLGNDLTASYGAPRTDKPLLARHRGRMFAAGAADYQEGMAQATNSSTSVKGIGTQWTTSLAGRLFEAAGLSVEIASVNATTQTLTLASAWSGSTSKFLEYAIRPHPYYRRSIFYSEADAPENWDPSCGLILSDSADQVTAMIDAVSYLWLATPTTLYKFAFDADPYLDGQCHPAAWRGCVNQRTWVRVEGSFYCLDRLGVYRLTDGATEDVSEPIRDLWVRESPGDLKIDWTLEGLFHACHDARLHAIRFFVSLGGPERPRHCLCYDYRKQGWWIEEYPFDCGSSAVLAGPERATVVLGPGLVPYRLGPAFGDGADLSGQVVSGGVVESGPLSVTVPSLTLPVSDIAGTPVAVTEGRGVGQVRLITSFSSGVVRVDRPWSVLPDSTSRVLVGAVPFLYRTGLYERSYGTMPRTLILEQWPMTDVPATVWVRSWVEGEIQSVRHWTTLPAQMDSITAARPVAGVPGDDRVSVHPERANGRAFISAPASRDRTDPGSQEFQVEVFGLSGREPYRIQGILEEGVGP